MKNRLFQACFWAILSLNLTAQADYFYPNAGAFNPKIPTPEQFLGYPIGSHHTRYDRIVAYFQELDRLSDRMTLEVNGETYEHRQQIVGIFTSTTNHARLEAIRQANLKQRTEKLAENVPLVAHLAYNVHGNEPSGGEAALLTAYYLAASESPETQKWLSDMVITLDPVINPDGRDRHAHWANMHKGSPMVADPNDREHNEVWPGGRTNHYWFDLNRDWFLLAHPESQNRARFYHRWHPYIQTDHHEMGTNSTFYFDPGKYSSNNPVVPPLLYDKIYPKFGEYFAAAMNQLGSMYFTKEAFDKLYPGYGSSYINFYGGAGFLFEQASSRGHLQETTTIPLSFGFTIRNQFVAALTTVRASLAEKTALIDLRHEFYRTSAAQAKANPTKAYVFGDTEDATRTLRFVNLLQEHHIDCYQLGATITEGGKKFEKNKAFVVPTEQLNYIMLRSIFEKGITYTDSIFYDASTWSLIHAFNLPYVELKIVPEKGQKINGFMGKLPPSVSKSNYAYAVELTDYNAHRFLYKLQDNGAIVQTAFRPFALKMADGVKKFSYGTLVIPVGLQRISADSLYNLIKQAAIESQIEVHTLQNGYATEGVDVGSGNIKTVKKPEALMLVGTGVSGYEAGEVWHLLDQRIGMPITKVDWVNVPNLNLNRYNTLVMVGGQYRMDSASARKIKAWVQAGGTLITLKTASEWAIKNGLVREALITDTSRIKKRLAYDEAAGWEGAKAIGGSIFEVDLDLSHPIGFGFTNRKVSVYRNGTTFLKPSEKTYNTVAQYTANPLIGGYLHRDMGKYIANSAAILVSEDGAGRVILFADNPNFRATWYGTNKLFLNALFFGGNITPLSNFGG
jgi:Zinc carboxypeptidase